ncbi:toxin glutamine deamidase domain-containing protein [Rhizobium esperanzae]
MLYFGSQVALEAAYGALGVGRGGPGRATNTDGETAGNCSGDRCGSAADDIYGSARSMEEEFPELAGVNPHYVEGAGPGVNTNCVSCVNATVDRLTGRNPNAVADPSSGYGVPNDLNSSAPFGFSKSTSPANVTTRLLSEGDGAIAVVRIQQTGAVEHVIVGVNRSGTVRYIDPQLGSVVELQPNLTVIPGYR